MTTTKITKRVMFETIKGLVEDGIVSDEVIVQIGENEVAVTPAAIAEFCEKEIASLDKKAAKAKETAAAKKVAGDALRDAVEAVLTEDYEIIADIAAKVEDPDATVAKVTYRLNKLVEVGIAEKTELVIEGGEGQKKRKVQGYRLKSAE